MINLLKRTREEDVALKDAAGKRYPQKIFCLYDSVAQDYGFPVVRINQHVLFREIQEEILRGQSPMAKHPSDYTIFEVGEWDSTNGQFDFYEAKKSLGLVQDLKISSAN